MHFTIARFWFLSIAEYVKKEQSFLVTFILKYLDEIGHGLIAPIL